jgi:HSP20 family protein
MIGYFNTFGIDPTWGFMGDLRKRLDYLFDELNRAGGGDRRDFAEGSFAFPRLNLRDDGESFVLTAELPGMRNEDLKVSLENDVLTLSGTRADDAPEGYVVHRRERAPIRFSRSFSLPVRVDGDKTTAELRDGVLTLTLPKAKEAMPRQISVKAA